MTYTEIQTKIASNKWPEEAVTAINQALPSLGPSALNYFDNNCSDFGNNYAIRISKVIAQIPMWQTDIAEGREQSLITALVQALEAGDLTVIGLLSAFVYDLHRNRALAANLPPMSDRSLFVFQAANMENLPTIELAEALADHPLDLGMIFNLESELKRFAYYKDLTKESRELATLRNSLESSTQLLSGVQIKVDGQMVECNIKNLIRDFNVFAAGLSTKSSSYAVAQYATASPTMKALDKVSAKLLIRVLEAYTWLLGPSLTETEVNQYEVLREEILEQLPKLITNPPSEILVVSSQPVKVAAPAKLPEFDAARPTPSPTIMENKYDMPFDEDRAAMQPNRTVNVPNQYSANPAKIHDMVNRKPKMGVVMDPTNIKMEEEKRRMERDKTDQADIIQFKLAELRKRNKTE